jgi:hypothetical protein
VNRIFLAEPTLTGNERKYVLDCLDSNWISSIGKYIPAFEERFAEFCGVRHAIATSLVTKYSFRRSPSWRLRTLCVIAEQRRSSSTLVLKR